MRTDMQHHIDDLTGVKIHVFTDELGPHIEITTPQMLITLPWPEGWRIVKDGNA